MVVVVGGGIKIKHRPEVQVWDFEPVQGSTPSSPPVSSSTGAAVLKAVPPRKSSSLGAVPGGSKTNCHRGFRASFAGVPHFSRPSFTKRLPGARLQDCSTAIIKKKLVTAKTAGRAPEDAASAMSPLGTRPGSPCPDRRADRRPPSPSSRPPRVPPGRPA